jgi:hypothetical protein
LAEDEGVETFADSVAFLWGDDLYSARKLSYESARLIGIADKPIQRYCIIRVMEELGNVFFTTGVGYVMPLENEPSAYMSHDHLELENGHLQGEVEDNEPHQDILTDLVRDMHFDTVHDREVAEKAMLATFKLFDNMLLAVYNKMAAPGSIKDVDSIAHVQ